MKKKYGKPYSKPTTRPTFKFLSVDQSCVIEAFESLKSVEVFQTRQGHEQRFVMDSSTFDRFYNTIVNNGFLKVS